MYQVRTDLALEAREKFEGSNVEVKGVKVSQDEVHGNMKVTKVMIETENGAKIMGKPRGNYITLEAPDMADNDENYHREISKEIAKLLRELMPIDKKELSVLVVGLGNREVTPDALGPRVVDNMMITRHIIRKFGKYAFGLSRNHQISSIVPGVMAQTGMETLEIIKGVLDETTPDYIIAIDALAARSTKRLSRTIQITDTGISPGSGVGNHRHALNKESMGVPVIAIGIPTVVDAVTIVSDTMSNLVHAMEESRKLEDLGKSISSLEEAEKNELIRELLSPNLNTMFVTPKDIDESVKRLSYTISEGINMAFFPA
ncbi:MAG: GPR endopeptidase [Lachnospiraceae bacterium]|nr:GPR endopeptidase [Lachnospiraceae bacterium]